MSRSFTWLAVLIALIGSGHRVACAAEEPIRWLVEFEGQKEAGGGDLETGGRAAGDGAAGGVAGGG